MVHSSNMKYRITKDEKGFRALVGKQSRFGVEFRFIEEDESTNLIRITRYFNTKDKAIAACKEHHIKMGYDKLPKVVDEFEL